MRIRIYPLIENDENTKHQKPKLKQIPMIHPSSADQTDVSLVVIPNGIITDCSGFAKRCHAFEGNV
jgi:hypothetical protein